MQASVRIDKEQIDGAREFIITFDEAIDPAVNGQSGFGIENLTWTPEVLFAGNTIRNNRARGSLFSTPRKTVVENNLFDHTSGAAYLVVWRFVTAGLKPEHAVNVIIRKNRFVNALTNFIPVYECSDFDLSGDTRLKRTSRSIFMEDRKGVL